LTDCVIFYHVVDLVIITHVTIIRVALYTQRNFSLSFLGFPLLAKVVSPYVHIDVTIILVAIKEALT